mmetsp:Transcript_29233/g.81626  ORF Transcript_29233/g.81626 Transcript_29233/m.81626 type:complete len:230 (+) Transcript_29233:93-782(+)
MALGRRTTSSSSSCACARTTTAEARPASVHHSPASRTSGRSASKPLAASVVLRLTMSSRPSHLGGAWRSIGCSFKSCFPARLVPFPRDAPLHAAHHVLHARAWGEAMDLTRACGRPLRAGLGEAELMGGRVIPLALVLVQCSEGSAAADASQSRGLISACHASVSGLQEGARAVAHSAPTHRRFDHGACWHHSIDWGWGRPLFVRLRERGAAVLVSLSPRMVGRDAARR